MAYGYGNHKSCMISTSRRGWDQHSLPLRHKQKDDSYYDRSKQVNKRGRDDGNYYLERERDWYYSSERERDWYYRSGPITKKQRFMDTPEYSNRGKHFYIKNNGSVYNMGHSPGFPMDLQVHDNEGSIHMPRPHGQGKYNNIRYHEKNRGPPGRRAERGVPTWNARQAERKIGELGRNERAASKRGHQAETSFERSRANSCYQSSQYHFQEVGKPKMDLGRPDDMEFVTYRKEETSEGENTVTDESKSISDISEGEITVMDESDTQHENVRVESASEGEVEFMPVQLKPESNCKYVAENVLNNVATKSSLTEKFRSHDLINAEKNVAETEPVRADLKCKEEREDAVNTEEVHKRIQAVVKTEPVFPEFRCVGLPMPVPGPWNESDTENREFTKTICKTDLVTLRISTSEGEKLFPEIPANKKRTMEFVCEDEGKKWPILCSFASKCHELRRGWTSYVKSKGLQVGNVVSISRCRQVLTLKYRKGPPTPPPPHEQWEEAASRVLGEKGNRVPRNLLVQRKDPPPPDEVAETSEEETAPSTPSTSSIEAKVHTEMIPYIQAGSSERPIECVCPKATAGALCNKEVQILGADNITMKLFTSSNDMLEPRTKFFLGIPEALQNFLVQHGQVYILGTGASAGVIFRIRVVGKMVATDGSGLKVFRDLSDKEQETLQKKRNLKVKGLSTFYIHGYRVNEYRLQNNLLVNASDSRHSHKCVV